jgi:hypothetical protein
MANNPAIYNAVIAGITGANQSRFLLPTGTPNFTIFATLVETVAETIDNLIAPLSEMNDSIVMLMQSICQGYFEDRSVEALRHELPIVAGIIVDLFNAGFEILEATEPDSNGTTIPEGTYAGQPVFWNGSEWTPLPEGSPLSFQKINNTASTETELASLELDAAHQFVGIGVGEELERGSLEDTILLKNVTGALSGESSVQIDPTAVSISHTTNSGDTAVYTVGDNFHDLSVAGQSVIRIEYDGTNAKIGFFGATPVSTQSITGTTETQIMESIITALVNLGLVIDSR